MRDRQEHAASLEEQLSRSLGDVDARRAEYEASKDGLYLDFVGEPGYDLKYQSLEDLRQGIRLRTVQRLETDQGVQVIATVYVPRSKRGHFLRKVRDYTEKESRSGRPRNADLVDGVSAIRASVLKSFWRPEEWDAIPKDSPGLVELWTSTDARPEPDATAEVLGELGIEVRPGSLEFPERVVRLIKATSAQLESLIELSDDVAEFRSAPALAMKIIGAENRDQVAIVEELLSRADFLPAEVSVCILDTGVNNGHSLLQPALADNDLHAVDEQWGVEDHHGHGTLMAGTALWGDLLGVLSDGGPVSVAHRLESSKILPPAPKENPQELWGHMTQQGVYLAEIENPGFGRVACLAVTATDTRERGEPSSWSAAIDELTSGHRDNKRRLLVVSAGNAEHAAWGQYPQSNLSDEVHDPGQSWNALTVGAYTEKHSIDDDHFTSYAPIAPPGGLSPASTTSLAWPPRRWPIKPEVLFEGGNVASGPNGSLFDHDNLKMVSTYRDPQVAQFAPFFETSAAAAQAANLAAGIMTRYPGIWPETVRGLVVHSARWTEALRQQFLDPVQNKSAYARFLRTCGYGVPDLTRATRCASNSLTLVSQAELQPYARRADGRHVTDEMHTYDLPWPAEELATLGETPVEMRVTLSYFIEPSPGEVGWRNRYRYPSHLLRFDVKSATETPDQFVARINDQAQDDEDQVIQGGADNWLIGEARNVGSIHSDIWRGTAADLAASGVVAVFPAVGWWRERHHLGRWSERCRYSLIVSIESPREDIDIYTPVAVRVAVPVTVGT